MRIKWVWKALKICLLWAGNVLWTPTLTWQTLRSDLERENRSKLDDWIISSITYSLKMAHKIHKLLHNLMHWRCVFFFFFCQKKSIHKIKCTIKRKKEYFENHSQTNGAFFCKLHNMIFLSQHSFDKYHLLTNIRCMKKKFTEKKFLVF